MRIKKLLPVVLILISSLVNAQHLMFSELLSRPTDNSVTIQLTFADSVQVSVQYDTTSGTYTNQTSWQTFADSVPAVTVLTNLLPDKQYFYRVRFRKPGGSTPVNRPEYTFHTQRAPGSTFTFDLEADPHDDANSDTGLYRQCLLNQLSDKPDFMIDLGDFLMTDKLLNNSHVVPFDTIPYRCNLYRDFYSTSGHSVPLFIAMGNHEGEAGWYLNNTANNVAVWDAQVRTKYFLNPEPDNFYTGDTTNYSFIGKRGSYYAWKWGDALFVVIDPFWYTKPKPDSLNGWYWSLGKTQYDWLKTTLESSTASYKFVFAHQLVGGVDDGQGRGGVEAADFYEWGGKNLDSTEGFVTKRPGWYKPIKDLLTENRVNIFFHGHDHFFGEQEKDCMIYQETPQPSLPNFNYPQQAAQYGYYSGLILPNSGHLRVTVGPTGVKVEYVRVYLPVDTNAGRHNKDVSATYFINAVNCYDSLATGVPVLWNSNFSNELVYPNPFMKDTKIEFTLKRADKIQVAVYNSSGAMVRNLVAGNLIAEGQYQIIWDGKSATGEELASGIYLYEIRGQNSGVKSGKIILSR